MLYLILLLAIIPFQSPAAFHFSSRHCYWAMKSLYLFFSCPKMAPLNPFLTLPWNMFSTICPWPRLFTLLSLKGFPHLSGWSENFQAHKALVIWLLITTLPLFWRALSSLQTGPLLPPPAASSPPWLTHAPRHDLVKPPFPGHLLCSRLPAALCHYHPFASFLCLPKEVTGRASTLILQAVWYLEHRKRTTWVCRMHKSLTDGQRWTGLHFPVIFNHTLTIAA